MARRKSKAAAEAAPHPADVSDHEQQQMVTFCDPEVLAAAAAQLSAADPKLAPLIEEFGPPERLLAKSTSCFRSLAKSILYQQLAGTAAAAIYSRFLAVCGVHDETQLSPAAVLAADPAALRGCGLSERKASYLQELATHFQDGRLSDGLLTSLPDAELLAMLTAVRGIGPWTVDMFAMFHLGRPDVLPTGDLGVRKGLAHLFGLSHLPSPSEMEQLTAHWRPYRSLGCYYMWRIPLPAAKRSAAGGNSKSGKSAAAGARAKRAKKAVASPLGAAVAAVADVGVSVTAPVLAAGSAAAAASAAGRVSVVASVAAANSAWGCKEEQQQQQSQQQDLVTPLKPAGPADSGHSNGSSGAAAAAGRAADPSSSTGGMVTRRQLRWAQRSAATAATAVKRGGGLAPRIVDL